ncbi:16S rRNA (cytidine(1402)-2'-O)-methyltransferase [bacterium]|nr:16S rRNA (cytidine(1402)-2'-O)-methyltransferase [bacterium]
MSQSELYVVATPLGNRGDITLRAIECLKEVPWIFAEDTRETLKLLEICGISAGGKKVHSYASHNLKRATELAVEILAEGKNVALVTDRGTPAISDPGALLVEAARAGGFKVVPIPGVSAVTALACVSGLLPGEFAFVGFPPQQEKHFRELLDQIRAFKRPAVFYESPRRVRETVQALSQAFPQGRVFVGREMTKVHEEYYWLDLAGADLATLPEQGEYTLLVTPGESRSEESWRAEVALRAATDKEWSKDVASRHGVTARDIYNALQHLRHPPEEG